MDCPSTVPSRTNSRMFIRFVILTLAWWPMANQAAAADKPQVRAEDLYKGKPTSFWIERLKNKDEAKRLEALEAIAAIGPNAESATQALVKALDDDSEEIRINALKALEKVGPGALGAAPELMRRLSDKDGTTQYAVQCALSEIGKADEKTIRAVIEMALRDKNKETQRETIFVLHLMGAKAAKLALPVFADYVTGKKKPPAELKGNLSYIAMLLYEAGEEALPVLIEALRSGDQTSSISGCCGLVELEEIAIPKLIELLKDKDPRVRELSACTLGWTLNEGRISRNKGGIPQKDRRATETALHALLQDKDESVRTAAKAALERRVIVTQDGIHFEKEWPRLERMDRPKD